ncbi:MAG: GxxExxY protein [Bacteroidetes bacterium]|nr:GxxExxY protein [Bacteroidota bacterium]
MDRRQEIEALASKLVNIAFKIHTELGPGLFESVYEEVFCIELMREGIAFKRQHPIDIYYLEHRIESAFRVDIFVDETIILELKSVEELHKVHHKQLQTYLKLTGIRLGLLINFNEALIKDGIKRIVNGL